MTGSHLPRGLNPVTSLAPGGTAEAVPFPKPYRIGRRRQRSGFAQPDLSAGLLGLLTLLIVPVQILLVAFAMRGFSQGWNVEIERRQPTAGADVYPEAPPHPA